MLSYNKMIFLLDSLDSAANADSIQTSTIRKTCGGPSDLEKHQTKKDYARCLDGHKWKNACAGLTSEHD